MQTGLFAACGGALLIGATALVVGGSGQVDPAAPTGVRIYTPAADGWLRGPGAGEREEKRLGLDIAGATLEGVLQSIASQRDLQSFFRVQDLVEVGLDLEDEVSLKAPALTLTETFTLLNETLGRSGSESVDYRVRDGVMEIASARYFDKREARLAVYDVAPILQQNDPMELIDLIVNIVSPEDWTDNGGDLAQVRVLDGRLFISAPPRMHQQVAWILEQLVQQDGSAGSRLGTPRPESARSPAGDPISTPAATPGAASGK